MYQSIKEVTTQSLKDHVTLIHYFGLGFIQVKLGTRYRMHFCTDLLPAIVGVEDVHNHRYNFTSQILSGVFTQEIFSLEEGATHILEQESCREGVTPDEPPRPCSIRLMSTEVFVKGSSYTLAHHALHRVSGNKAITLLKRDTITKEYAEVVRPIGASLVCPFSKKVSEDCLWKIVEDMLCEAKISE